MMHRIIPNRHICVYRVLIFLAEQVCVVPGKILLLTLAHLAAHHEARAQLDGLRLDES